MTIRYQAAIVVTLAAALVAPLTADRVKLRSGKFVEGTFLGGDSKTVRVLKDDGSVSAIPLEEAVSVEFSARKPPPPPPPPPPKPAPAAAAAAAPAKPAPVTVPAGTAINVRLTQTIEVDASQAGQTFKGTVDDPVRIGGSVVIPRGATANLQAVKVEQSGKMKGSDKISLKVHSIAFGGLVYDVTTGYVESSGKGEGKKTARKVGGGAGLGGVLGGIVGGGEGVAIGAAVGAVTGAAIASGGEEHLKVPAETRLQFQLTEAVKIQP